MKFFQSKNGKFLIIKTTNTLIVSQRHFFILSSKDSIDFIIGGIFLYQFFDKSLRVLISALSKIVNKALTNSSFSFFVDCLWYLLVPYWYK